LSNFAVYAWERLKELGTMKGDWEWTQRKGSSKMASRRRREDGREERER
jgi:hypothetical protein